MLVLIPERLDPATLGELPDGVELRAIGAEPDEEALASAEVVLDPESVLARLGDMPRLRAVIVTSAGVEWVAPHVPAGVKLANARGTRDAAVAEWVVGAVLAMEKRLFDQRAAQAERRWDRFRLPDLAGRTALILGPGSIGTAVEARLAPFEVDVLRVARTAREGVHAIADLPRLLPGTDVLVILVPLTARTGGLVGAEELALLPDGALVVNAGRGAVVDTDALVAELERGRLRAALDVVDPEPLPEDHPLWGAPGAFISPHVAGDSARADAAALRLAGEQLRRLAWGAPLLNVVDGD